MNQEKNNLQSTFTIRTATEADLKQIQTLFKETIETSCTADYSPEQIQVWASSADNNDRWIGKIRNQFFIIILDTQKIIGFASLENHSLVDMLYVHKDYQRQAVASQLFEALLTEAKRGEATELTSNVSITAKAFFEKNGFETISERKNKIGKVVIINFSMRKGLGKE